MEKKTKIIIKHKNMKEKLVKIVVTVMAVAAALLFLTARGQEEAPDLTVAFFDVGQGDAVLITVGESTQILIDGGPDSSVLAKLGEYMPFYDHKIELVCNDVKEPK